MSLCRNKLFLNYFNMSLSFHSLKPIKLPLSLAIWISCITCWNTFSRTHRTEALRWPMYRVYIIRLIPKCLQRPLVLTFQLRVELLNIGFWTAIGGSIMLFDMIGWFLLHVFIMMTYEIIVYSQVICKCCHKGVINELGRRLQKRLSNRRGSLCFKTPWTETIHEATKSMLWST